MVPERLLRPLGLMKGYTERMSSNVHTAVAILQFCLVICPFDQVQLKKLEKTVYMKCGPNSRESDVKRCHLLSFKLIMPLTFIFLKFISFTMSHI